MKSERDNTSFTITGLSGALSSADVETRLEIDKEKLDKEYLPLTSNEMIKQEITREQLKLC